MYTQTIMNCENIEVIDYLNRTFDDNFNNVINNAMHQIQLIERPMPQFMTVCYQPKSSFYKFLCTALKKLEESDYKSMCVQLAMLIDTVTCLLGSDFFYEEYSNSVAHIYKMMMVVVGRIQSCCYGAGFTSNQIKILIKILTTSAERLNRHKYPYNRINDVIKELETYQDVLNRIEKRKLNNLEGNGEIITETTVIHASNKFEEPLKKGVKVSENKLIKIAKPLKNNIKSNNRESNIERKLLESTNKNDIMTLSRSRTATNAFDLMMKSRKSVHIPKENDRPTINAFEKLMLSSKLTSKK